MRQSRICCAFSRWQRFCVWRMKMTKWNPTGRKGLQTDQGLQFLVVHTYHICWTRKSLTVCFWRPADNLHRTVSVLKSAVISNVRLLRKSIIQDYVDWNSAGKFCMFKKQWHFPSSLFHFSYIFSRPDSCDRFKC